MSSIMVLNFLLLPSPKCWDYSLIFYMPLRIKSRTSLGKKRYILSPQCLILKIVLWCCHHGPYWYGLCCHLRPWWCSGPWSYCSLSLCRCLWPVLPPKAMRMSMVYAVAWSHVDIYGLSWRLRPCWCSCPVLPRAVMMSVASAETILMCVVCTAAWDHAEVCGICRCVDVCGQCFCQKSCVNSWSILPLTVKNKEDTSAMVLMTTDSQLIGHRRLLWQPLLPHENQCNSLDRKPSKRNSKNCDKDGEM